ncbi:MAG: site-specific DNA-methyltransferase [Syntrophales bacterium]|nr:site-specific DNA-methyltransferase [Syntrophales bacterium]
MAKNVQKWGTGAINIDASRIPTNGDKPTGSGRPVRDADPKAIQPGRSGGNGGNETPPQGRWPANLIHDGSDEVVELFPVTGASKATNRGLQHSGRHGGLADIGSNIKEGTDTVRGHNDNGGSAARFFYCAKASKKDRGEDNKHPTVKPTDLMRYLCRLVTPPNGLILDPFMGSGTTGMAAKAEGFRFIGIEKEQEYCEIAERRISAQ